MATEFKTSHRSKEWKEGFAQFGEYSDFKERNPYTYGSRQYSEYQQGFLSAYIEDAEKFNARNRYF
jgi:hypothetical protein